MIGLWQLALMDMGLLFLLFVQVSRLLVGGVKVIGIYVWVAEIVFKNSTLVLCQVNMART